MQLPRLENTTGTEDDSVRKILATLELQGQDVLSADLVRLLVRLDRRIEEIGEDRERLCAELRSAEGHRTDF